MSRFRHCAVFLLAVFLIAGVIGSAAPQNPSQTPTATLVNLRWEKRSGVSRYRLQIARDHSFTDNVLDRVVNGNEVRIDSLDPGRYFWRVAPMNSTRGEFSSPALIEVRATPPSKPNTDTRPPDRSPIAAGDGWRSAVGDINRMVAARLRSANQFDIVVTNRQGVTFGIDSSSGVPIWSKRLSGKSPNSTAPVDPLVVPAKSGLDDLVIFDGEHAVYIEGKSGRELWRSTTPTGVSAAAVVKDPSRSLAVIVDGSLARLFVLNAADGKLLVNVTLTRRILPTVVPLEDRSRGEFLIAYESGQIEVRDISGGIVRSGSVGNAPTTPPLLVRGTRGVLLLIGTREGLAAFTADELRALGLVTLKDDMPRGRLFAADLDGDGVDEVAMLTARRRLGVVNAADGKILWIADLNEDVQALAFADLNNDRVMDIFVSGRETFLTALSGRDGSTIWKDNEPPAASANHAVTGPTRTLLTLPHASGALLVASEPSRTGVRAVVLSNATVRPRLH